MKDKSLFKMHADVCKALAHSIRIEIIDILKDKEKSFGELLKITGVPKSNLSQHLSVMNQKGILIHRKEGLRVYHKLSSPKVYNAFYMMREVLKERILKQKELIKNIK
ncbi:MAG: metalloregulator ArsR/SmtB family transcription factor [Chlorobi bacterium]|nr:metalloregulator ArsR/SmtB family transcription factor [Chlorobiota bacterium]MCI0717158.1 metalloregulator ArsR/SmtB family transcription factor [Chlorobiota bacterium]